MNVLHVNNVDLHGRRFNGYDLLADLEPRGVNGRLAVLTKLSDNPRVFSLWSDPIDAALHDALARVEARHSMNNLLFPWGRVLASSAEFRNADVVHYHLLHNQVISLFDLPMLFGAKPSVWTFHDPWPLTGHCIHPGQCTGWLTGCHNCPALDEPFPLECDFSSRLWRIKKAVLSRLDADIIVASEFMKDMVVRSPLTAHFARVHLIPFGVETQSYLPDEEKSRSREMLGIRPDDFTLLVRAKPWGVKGLDHIIRALESRPPTHPITILTVDQTGLLQALSRQYTLVELGWVDDEMLLRRIYSACDVLLMPSVAESFGLMALEAMASGRPVISFQGTSVATVTEAPECGIAVRMGDASALRDAIDMLVTNPDEARRRGRLGREIAERNYSHEVHLDALISLYASLARQG